MNRILSTRRGISSTASRFGKILISDPIEAQCKNLLTLRGHQVDEFPNIKPDELKSIIGKYDALVVRSRTKVTQDIIENGKKLKVIGRAGTGVDNIDVQAATHCGVLVANTPGGNTISTAELAISHLLALARHIPQATTSLKSGEWKRSAFTGDELSGKTLGVIGIGKIGRYVAQACKEFGMNTIGFDPILIGDAGRRLGIEPVSLKELLKRSDFITIHTPLTKETYHLINGETLKDCKQGCKIINCARGGIVDEESLLDAINSGRVSGAALDVLEQEPPTAQSWKLRSHPKVVVTPHLGASTKEAQEKVAVAIAENISNIFDYISYSGVVNSPDLSIISKQQHLMPYIMLAEKIGAVQSQLLKGKKIGGISINMRGRDISTAVLGDIFKSAVLKGCLSGIVDSPVSYVNAISIADEIGLRVTINLSEKTNENSGLRNSLSVDLELENSPLQSIEGTVFGKSDPRITRINDYAIDVPFSKTCIIFNNSDVPGVLRKVADSLVEENINIAHFSLGRKADENLAMGAIVVDSCPSQSLMKKLESLEDIKKISLIQLKDETDSFKLPQSSSETSTTFSRRPAVRPAHPEFSSGPCKKRPGYDIANLPSDVLGRSHRSKLGKQRLAKAIEDTKKILGIPDDYLCGIVAGSDTGAFEMAMWNMLGERPVDLCHWESFGKGWKDDAMKHLGLKTSREFSAEYGKIADLSSTNPDHDIVFTYNGTTSGVRVPNLDWVKSDRTGLTFNDATSAAFAMDIDWTKSDVTTFSWQKVLGGEGAHGMLILSPRAVQRLESYDPKRPLPKIFRMTKKDANGKVKIDKNIFLGDTINTPSMLCVEDYIDALEWASSIGGLNELIRRSKENLAVLEQFVDQNEWIDFLAESSDIRSNTSVCLTINDMSKNELKQMISLLEMERVAFDIGSYRDAPAGLRIWCGATVEKKDLESLLPWLEWARDEVMKSKFAL